MILTLSAPVLYALELTPVCNNRCLGCCNVFEDARTHSPLPLEAWRQVLNQIKPHAHLVKLTGGEPTLHPDFQGIVVYLDGLGIPYSLFTNGCWPDPERLVCMLETTLHLRGLLISLHGATPESHEFFTGVRGSFETTLTNIQRAAQAGLQIAISTVIHRRNLDQFREILVLAGDLGTDHVVFNRYLGPKNSVVEPTQEQLRQAVLEIEALRQTGARAKLGNCIPQCFVESSSTGCLAGVAYCTIDPWGNMRPCNHSPLVCANLLQCSIEEAWQSAKMQHWREMVPMQCFTCVEFSQCHGGCRAMAVEWGLEKDPLAREPISVPPPPPEPISLSEGLRPIGMYQLREEAFGYVLMRGNCIVPIAFADKAVLDACNGQMTLKDIKGDFGVGGLHMIVALAMKGLLEFQ